MLADPKVFFDLARGAPFGGRLRAHQVDGLNAILEGWSVEAIADRRQLAYVLATAFHETGGRMEPVRESFARDDAGARRALAKRAYAVADPETGHAYYGRGLVQITWRDNYERLGRRIGVELVRDPDRALEISIAVRLLIVGMVEGLYTGRRLEQYFGAAIDDPVGARRIINGSDRAADIAVHHRAFLDALTRAG